MFLHIDQSINIIIIWTEPSLKNAGSGKNKNGRSAKDRKKIIGSKIESVKDHGAKKGGSHE